MDRGDLSNVLAPIVGVRFEAVIYNFGQVNQPGKAYLDNLLRRDVNVYLISTLSDRKVKGWCYKWGVLYTRVIEADSILEIPEIVFQNKMMMYVDTDDKILETISLRGNVQTIAEKWEQPLEYRERPNTETDRGGRT